MKWFAKRFRYTRELQDRTREQDQEIHVYELIVKAQKELLEEYELLGTKYTKLTLNEAHELFSACVDYHRILKMLVVGDPVQERVLPLFDKYDIKVDRNAVVDQVIREAERYAADASRRSDTDK